MMTDVMIDIETLGTRAGCVFHEISAVHFDPVTGTRGAEFSIVVDIQDALAYGLEIDEKTVEWWRAQKLEINQESRRSLFVALSSFHGFLSLLKPERVWSWGAHFDFPILEAGFDKIGARAPYHYAKVRDARSIWDAAFPGVIHDRAPGHSALSDCRQQVAQVAEAIGKLQINFFDDGPE